MTPRELQIYADAYAVRLEQEQEQRQQTIYAAAALIARFVWAKRLPDYAQVFKKQQPDMTNAELLQQAETLTAMLGG